MTESMSEPSSRRHSSVVNPRSRVLRPGISGSLSFMLGSSSPRAFESVGKVWFWLDRCSSACRLFSGNIFVRTLFTLVLLITILLPDISRLISSRPIQPIGMISQVVLGLSLLDHTLTLLATTFACFADHVFSVDLLGTLSFALTHVPGLAPVLSETAHNLLTRLILLKSMRISPPLISFLPSPRPWVVPFLVAISLTLRWPTEEVDPIASAVYTVLVILVHSVWPLISHYSTRANLSIPVESFHDLENPPPLHAPTTPAVIEGVDLAVIQSVGGISVNRPESVHRPTRATRVLDSSSSLHQLPRRHSTASSSLSLDLVNSWDLNPLTLSPEDTFSLLEYIFYFSPEGAFIQRVDTTVFANFVSTVQVNYNPNPYHQWAHAVDVCHTVYRYIDLSESKQFLRPMDRLGLLVAALVHDIGHVGVNNQFMVDTHHELAVRFNDRSPLENFHCALFFDIIHNGADCNVLAWLTKDQYKEIRKVIIDSVLHTDNAYHFGMVKEVVAFVDQQQQVKGGMSGEEAAQEAVISALKTADARVMINNLFLHAADISNPTKPFVQCRQWASLVMEEFFAQGDQERELGIPVQPLNDRTKTNVFQSQVGFIEFVVAPLELAKFRLFPVFSDNCQFLIQNMIQWASEVVNQQSATTTTPEEEQKLLDRCRRIANQFQAHPGMGGVFIPNTLRIDTPTTNST